jgi:hypothetical protein
MNGDLSEILGGSFRPGARWWEKIFSARLVWSSKIPISRSLALIVVCGPYKRRDSSELCVKSQCGFSVLCKQILRAKRASRNLRGTNTRNDRHRHELEELKFFWHWIWIFLNWVDSRAPSKDIKFHEVDQVSDKLDHSNSFSIDI